MASSRHGESITAVISTLISDQRYRICGSATTAVVCVRCQKDPSGGEVYLAAGTSGVSRKHYKCLLLLLVVVLQLPALYQETV